MQVVHCLSQSASRRRTFPTSKTGNSTGPVCDSAPNDCQTTKRDKLETVTHWPVLAQVTATATPVNFFSSISLHLRPPTNYYGGAITIVFPGIVPSLLPRGGKTSARIHSSSVMHVVSSSCRALMRKASSVRVAGPDRSSSS